MRKRKSSAGAARAVTKRLLAAGRKMNGTWEVRTFLRVGSADQNAPLWETASRQRHPAT